MCGRYTLRTKLNLLLSEFAADLAPGVEWEPRYNIPPTANVPAVRLVDGKRQLTLFQWGLVPSWAKDTKIAYSTINARADTVATKPAFRTAYKKRRCLVLADGYIEWEKSGKDKLPWLYEVEGKPFAFAGLWEAWYGQGEGKPPLESCTIITTDANELAAKVHNPLRFRGWQRKDQLVLSGSEVLGGHHKIFVSGWPVLWRFNSCTTTQSKEHCIDTSRWNSDRQQ